MNWRRGLFRLWIVGSALFVIAFTYYAYNGFSEMKAEFEAAASKPKASVLATSPTLANAVYERFYSDMPREQFDKKITTGDPITEPKVIAQLKAIITQLDTSRPWDQWTYDELLASSMYPNIFKESPPPTATVKAVGLVAAIAFGIPLVVLVLGSSLIWAFSGFAAKRS